MRIFSRYVFRQAAGSFLLILVSLTGVVWIALALRQFNVVTSEGQDTWMLIKMTSLALPNLMAIIAPFSFLIAALHTLNRLNTDSELIVRNLLERAMLARVRKPADEAGLDAQVETICSTLAATRPTAVNLFWAIDRMKRLYGSLNGKPLAEIRERLVREAILVREEDIAINRAIGSHWAALVPDHKTVLTHCGSHGDG